jgi:hypothetical protein
MYALLASHSNIAMANLGSNMWTFFYGQYGDLGRRENFEQCLAALMRYKNALILDPDAERIRKEFWQGEPTYARLFALLQEHFAERAGKRRWGDKTSYVERYADQIFGAYPGAVMIHLIRDPRDRYASAIKRWGTQKGRVGGATARWLYSVGLARRNLKKYPDQYRVVRYETLVSQPEATVREIWRRSTNPRCFPCRARKGSSARAATAHSNGSSRQRSQRLQSGVIARCSPSAMSRSFSFLRGTKCARSTICLSHSI